MAKSFRPPFYGFDALMQGENGKRKGGPVPIRSRKARGIMEKTQGGPGAKMHNA